VRHLVQTVRQWVPDLLLHFFTTTDEAIAWLQQTHALPTEGYRASQQQTASQVRLTQQVQVLQQQVVKRTAKLVEA
jgi:hypothetical protein